MKDYTKVYKLIRPVQIGIDKLGFEIYDQGYEEGYEDEKKDAHEKSISKTRAYEQGCEYTYEVLKKLCFTEDDGGLPLEEIRNIFNVDKSIYDVFIVSYILKHYSIYEIMQKINELEEQHKQHEEIYVGDEVYLCDPTRTRVVTSIYSENGYQKAIQVTRFGSYLIDDTSELHKTGRHFSQIDEVLKQLKG